MEVSWRKIKEHTDRIIEEFDRLYTYERNYQECEKLITDIFKVYSSKYNIQLDENEEFDHIFHQLLSEMEKVTKEFTPTDVQEQSESMKIDKLFATMSEDILKTAEIRGRLKEIDPSNFEFRRALEEGIKEAEARRAEVDESLGSVRGIFREIFGTGMPNLRTLTQYETNNISHLNVIEQKLKEVQALQKAMAGMTPGLDDVHIASNQARIDSLTIDIQAIKDRIGRTNLVDGNRLSSIGINDVTTSLAEVIAVRNELDKRATDDFTRLQANLAVVYNKYPQITAIARMDFSRMNPNTKEGRKAIKEAYGPLEEVYNALQMDYKVYDKEIQVYQEQIKQIDEEDKILEVEAPTKEKIASEVSDAMKVNIDNDLKYYQAMVNAQMYGSQEYKEKYDKYLKIFKKHILSGDRRPSFVLRNEDGSPILEADGTTEKVAKFMTVDYDGITQELQNSGMAIRVEELIKFLQLEDYREKLERDSKVAAGDKLALTEYQSYHLVKEAKTSEEKVTAIEALKAESARDHLYLNTYHYATNDYEFKKQYHATAGKIGETFIPLQDHEKGEGVGKALQISAHNLYAYTRWQNPLKADSFLKGVGIMVLNVGNIVSMLPRIVTRATGSIISKVKYNTEEDPNPYNGRRDARRGARVDYYRENGDGSFKARAKGWLDEFNSKRKKVTEQAIVDRQVEEIRKGLEESYINGAYEQTISEIESPKDIVRRNREIRAQDARKIASTWETQGDIIRDTKDLDEKILRQRTMQRVALEYSGIDSGYVSNTGSRSLDNDSSRNTQFTNGKPDLKGKREIKGVVYNPDIEKVRWGRKKGSVVSADPIGRAIRSREIKNTLTRWYAIEEAALIKGQSALVKWGIGKIKDSKVDTTTEKTGEWQDTGKTKQVENGGHYENPGTTHQGVVGTREGNTASNIKMGDLEYQDQAYFEHTASSHFKSVGWNEAPTAQNTQAMSLDYIVPDNLTSQEYQILSQYGVKAGDRISYSIADEATKNLCQATGKTYANSYIDGMFRFTDDTNITQAIDQYFPKEVSGPLDVILESENYAGDMGVNFLTESFATSHGISSVMEKMNTWGTGWGIESVNPQALEAARKAVNIMGEVPDDPVWITEYIDVPIYEWVEATKNAATTHAKEVLKKNLNNIINGVEGVEYATEAYDLVRPSRIRKQPGREIYRGEDR